MKASIRIPRGMETSKAFQKLLEKSRNTLDYHIEGCFLCDTPKQEEDASKALKSFIKKNYIRKIKPKTRRKNQPAVSSEPDNSCCRCGAKSGHKYWCSERD